MMSMFLRLNVTFGLSRNMFDPLTTPYHSENYHPNSLLNWSIQLSSGYIVSLISMVSQASPHAIITGQVLNYNKHCCHEFGSYIQTHKEHDNTMELLGLSCFVQLEMHRVVSISIVLPLVGFLTGTIGQSFLFLGK
jgi:hypothetical protein